jgi:hypothetical protein
VLLLPSFEVAAQEEVNLTGNQKPIRFEVVEQIYFSQIKLLQIQVLQQLLGQHS